MEKKLRAFLLDILGHQKYLALVSEIYIRLIRNGFLRKKYPELFYLKEIIKPGFVCVDIGANVGYYSVFLSKYAGNEGCVYAVEPVQLFAEIFKKNTQHFGIGNITLYSTALGGENKTIQMGTPVIDGVFRHGLTKVIDSDTSLENMHTYNVEMHVPDELFAHLQRFDFLKCDVEGYEVYLMPHFIKTISKFKPIIQMEISTVDNRKIIFDLFTPLSYRICKLNSNALTPLSIDEALQYEGGDFYFVQK
ncbi:MAG: FkbM family methyltransferase [Bacteroidia bacterium]|nr:FkbM family methyltransferase [Bacteroidia bacterium]